MSTVHCWHDQAALANNDLARTIAARQFANWRELRTKSFIAPVIMNALAALAKKIRDALARVSAQTEEGPVPKRSSEDHWRWHNQRVS